MKIITSQNYDGLAPDSRLGQMATEQDIANSAGPVEDPNKYKQQETYKQQGFLKTDVDWDALMESHVGLGYWDTPSMAEIEGLVPVELYYSFDYNSGVFDNPMPSNIEVTQAIVSFGGKKIIISKESGEVMDTDLLYRFKEDYGDIIAKDIQTDAANLVPTQM